MDNRALYSAFETIVSRFSFGWYLVLSICSVITNYEFCLSSDDWLSLILDLEYTLWNPHDKPRGLNTAIPSPLIRIWGSLYSFQWRWFLELPIVLYVYSNFRLSLITHSWLLRLWCYFNSLYSLKSVWYVTVCVNSSFRLRSSSLSWVGSH